MTYFDRPNPGNELVFQHFWFQCQMFLMDFWLDALKIGLWLTQDQDIFIKAVFI